MKEPRARICLTALLFAGLILCGGEALGKRCLNVTTGTMSDVCVVDPANRGARGSALGIAFDRPARRTPDVSGATLAPSPLAVQGLVGGAGLPADDLQNLAAFLGLLPAPPAPRLDASLVRRGQQVFEDPVVGCLRCHPGESGTDNLNHVLLDPETRSEREAIQSPFLLGLARTAPYLHDGSVLSDAMGRGSHLSEGDVDALIAYLESR